MAKKVLVVDDANCMRIIVRNPLEPNGFDIAGEAASGDEAVTKYDLLRPDLVTMEITMKDKDRIKAAREIMVRCPVVKPFTPARILSAAKKALA